MYNNTIPFWTYLHNSVSVGSNLFLDIIPFSMTFAFLLRNEDKLLMPTLNLAIAFYVFSFGYLVGMQEAIGLRCSVFYGQKNHLKFSQCFYRLVLIDLLMLCVSLTLAFFSYIPFQYMGLDDELTSRVFILILQMLPAKLIENISNLMKGILVSQKIFEPFTKINLISLTTFSFLNIIMVYFFDMELIGFLISYHSKMFLECLLLYLSLRNNVAEEYLKIPEMKLIFQNFNSEIKYAAFISLSQYGEWIAVELNTVFAALTGKVENIIAWGICLNFSQYFYFFLLGTSSCLRTYASIELGKKNVEGMYQIIRSCIYNGIVFISCFFVIIMLFTPYIVRIFTNDDQVIRILEITCRGYGFVFIVDFFLNQLNTLLRMIRKEQIQFLIGMVIWPICSLSFGYIFCLYLGLENLGLIISFFLTDVIATLILYWAFRRYEDEFVEKIAIGELSIFSEKNLVQVTDVDVSQELISKE